MSGYETEVWIDVIPSSAALSWRALIVRGDSMLPSYADRDVVLLSMSAFEKAGVARQDVVAIRDPEGSGRLYLKRIVGLPGERIALSDSLLFVDGRRLDEPYLAGLPSSLGLGETAWLLGEAEYLVLGDRRHRSTDSRRFGPVTERHIVGKAWLRIWPPGRWGRV